VGSLVRLDGQPAAPDQVSNHDLPLFQQAPAAPEKWAFWHTPCRYWRARF